MGNVRYVIDRVGNIVLAYDYDAWGNISVTPNAYYTLEHSPSRDYNANAISKLSDITYRGYFYDKDISLYYLINRYYDPAVGRFISADDTHYLDFETVFGYNRYAYCCNNPINRYDPMGTDASFWENIGNFFEKLGRSLGYFYESFQFEAGAGLGVGATVELSELVEISAVSAVDMIAIDTDSSVQMVGGKEFNEIGISIGPVEVFSIGDSNFHPGWDEDVSYIEKDKGYTISIGCSIYCVFGFNFSMSLDVETFWNNLVVLWSV